MMSKSVAYIDFSWVCQFRKLTGSSANVGIVGMWFSSAIQALILVNINSKLLVSSLYRRSDIRYTVYKLEN